MLELFVNCFDLWTIHKYFMTNKERGERERERKVSRKFVLAHVTTYVLQTGVVSRKNDFEKYTVKLPRA